MPRHAHPPSPTSGRARCVRPIATASLALAVLAGAARAQSVETLADAPGDVIFAAACAGCHGPDGRGLDRALVAFEEELPDFTDCRFASREPDGDWIAVAHEGGPVRGFSRMMPAFRGALTPEQLQRVMHHIRTLCTDPSWPRGELNLPRALVTEKAFPEDEWVVEGGSSLEGEGALDAAFVYERRFGSRNQLEVTIPYGWLHVPTSIAGDDLRWQHGLGDVALGFKRALHHDIEAGSIFSVGAEVVLPTGDETKGLGNPGAAVELFASAGKIVAGDGFVQAQAGFERQTWSGGESEAFGRLALGRTFTEGSWGRTWTPIFELLAARELEGGVPTSLDVVPQIQVSLNRRQHVLANVGFLVPATNREGRPVRLLLYLLLDWFDGGFFEGW